MRKIIINRCYGGFGLSPKAIARYAEIKGLECYFFKIRMNESDAYEPVSIEYAHAESKKRLAFFCAYTVPNPEEVSGRQDNFASLTMEERIASNKRWSDISIEPRKIPRDDPALIQVVKELGKEANTKFSELKIVNVPNEVEWEIQEYDGMECVAEKHRIWC